ncbi:MAG: 2Fe-2S iron-sulfur cluster-binding protein [Marinifilaceae bacterium]
MVKITIDNIPVEVPAGTSILNAAKSVGIHIPSMCYYNDGFGNHPSCMVCLVKDKNSGKLMPSCAVKVTEGMEIISEDEEVRAARKEALELLLSDHVGDCEAPCRVACPAFMNIPLMNRLIAAGKLDEAIKVVKEEIAIPSVLGYICSAPCEKACRRKQVDNPVAICLLKRVVALHDAKAQEHYLPEKMPDSGKRIAIIGTGPAGLASAYHLLREGHNCVLFDRNKKAGGSFLVSVQKGKLPQEVLEAEIKILQQYGTEFRLNREITPDIFSNEIQNEFDAVLLASGNMDDSSLKDFDFQFTPKGIAVEENSFATGITGVFACGSVVRPQKMAVKALAQGKEVALSINRFLKANKDGQRSKRFNSRFGPLFPAEIPEYMEESVSGDRIVPQDDLVGYSIEEAIEEARRCMHCDCRKPDTCKLRMYADEYQVDRKKFQFGERNVLRKYFQHDSVVYEPEKCIKCGLCVEITTHNGELTGLTHVGRGFDVRIEVPFQQNMPDALTRTAEECVKACPTGALSFK